MKASHALSLTPDEKRYVREVWAYLKRFFPFEVHIDGLTPRLVLPEEVEQAVTEKAARDWAEKMISGLLVKNGRMWRSAARESLHGAEIYKALKTEMSGSVGLRVRELIQQNARLLETLPEKLLERTQLYILREQQKGRRSEYIQEDLRKRLPQLTLNQVRLMARTEVARADTALTQARAESLSLNWYEWSTSRDQRVRPSHHEMEGVLVAWGDPPAPEQLIGLKSSLGHYHAGQTFQCRCLALPLMDIDEVKWPHKCYSAGHIHLVSRAQFQRLAKVSGPRAA